MTNDELKVKLLELEVDALRSVLSEFEGDKTEYTQMIAANAFESARFSLKPTSNSKHPVTQLVKCILSQGKVDMDTHAAYHDGRYTAVRKGVLVCLVSKRIEDLDVLKFNGSEYLFPYTYGTDYVKFQRQVVPGDCVDLPTDCHVVVTVK